MRRLWIALLMVTAALAGCIGETDEVDPAEDGAEDLTPPQPLETVIQQSHDHEDASLHGFAWNLDRVGYHPGYEDVSQAPDEPAGFSEGFRGFAVGDGYAYLCRGGDAPGVVILDVSDPQQPSFVSRFAMPQCNDVEVSEDGRWVFAGTQRNSIMDVAQESQAAPASTPRGTYVIDVQDKSQPAFESFFAQPYNGPHTVTTYTTEDGRRLVLHQSYDLYSTVDPTGQAPIPTPGGAAPGTHRSTITELVQAPNGTYQLERIGAYSATGQTAQNPDAQVIVHDAIVAHHPETGQRYLLIAYWDLGVHILDFSDPSDPTLVGTFEDFSPSDFANVHQVRAFPGTVDGKWVLVAEPELATAEESGQITFIDATDPANPTKLGYWTLPGNVTIPEPFLFSPHNFWLDDQGRVFLSHQHAGVWVIDVDDPGTLSRPATVGAIELTAPDGTLPGGPMTWGVEVHDGIVYAMDTPTGLHTLEYTGP